MQQSVCKECLCMCVLNLLDSFVHNNNNVDELMFALKAFTTHEADLFILFITINHFLNT